jgi:hypothetical protein
MTGPGLWWRRTASARVGILDRANGIRNEAAVGHEVQFINWNGSGEGGGALTCTTVPRWNGWSNTPSFPPSGHFRHHHSPAGRGAYSIHHRGSATMIACWIACGLSHGCRHLSLTVLEPESDRLADRRGNGLRDIRATESTRRCELRGTGERLARHGTPNRKDLGYFWIGDQDARSRALRAAIDAVVLSVAWGVHLHLDGGRSRQPTMVRY